jgi:hypothetical protein
MSNVYLIKTNFSKKIFVSIKMDSLLNYFIFEDRLIFIYTLEEPGRTERWAFLRWAC